MNVQVYMNLCLNVMSHYIGSFILRFVGYRVWGTMAKNNCVITGSFDPFHALMKVLFMVGSLLRLFACYG